jgi:hypothetical protein
MTKRFISAWTTLCICLSLSHTLHSESNHDLYYQFIQQTLNVPGSLASVTDVYWPNQKISPEYYLIQDVHRHPSVQLQIAALIERGYDAWGVKKIFMEGAFTGVDLSVFHRVPTRTQNFLLDRLVKDGHISGPELAAVHIMEKEWRNPPVSPFQLFGLEDPKLYQKNVLAFQSVMEQRDRALAELVPIRRMQETMHLPEPNAMLAQLDRTEALLRLKLTSSEFEDYLKNRALIPSTPILDPAIHAAEQFYQLAKQRSRIFVENAAKKDPASSAPRILVVGGFHTAYMAARLKEQGHSYVILTPAVTGQFEENPYEKNLLETANVMAEALAAPNH